MDSILSSKESTCPSEILETDISVLNFEPDRQCTIFGSHFSVHLFDFILTVEFLSLKIQITKRPDTVSSSTYIKRHSEQKNTSPQNSSSHGSAPQTVNV
ncbi:hypothetical protein TNIN_420081 [Trichonephila inaurata madagascariensis]|uniref:Uncharacterized protein n=1 Tax=Trichonephila inaurata madagascariensis TaxID=2747483 RepID=A0A8X6XNU3_9ARAC|nr:hypothetical protein TNIN_420081 [Trichonephila inaurata madagascariensis]